MKAISTTDPYSGGTPVLLALGTSDGTWVSCLHVSPTAVRPFRARIDNLAVALDYPYDACTDEIDTGALVRNCLDDPHTHVSVIRTLLDAGAIDAPDTATVTAALSQETDAARSAALWQAARSAPAPWGQVRQPA